MDWFGLPRLVSFVKVFAVGRETIDAVTALLLVEDESVEHCPDAVDAVIDRRFSDYRKKQP